MSVNFVLGVLAGAAAGAASAYWFYYRPRLRRFSRSRFAELNKQMELSSHTARESGGRMLAGLASMAEGVIIVDMKGKSLFVNSALSEALELKNMLTDGSYYWEIFRDPDVNQMLEKCLKDKQVEKREHSVLLSGKVFEIQVSPVFTDGNFLGAVGVFHDVTRLKELERVRAEFVANVSHELRTPLTSILGYIETLKEGAIDDKQNRFRFLSIVEEHAKRLGSLVEDLLLLSSIESGLESLRLQDTDFEKVLTAALNDLGPVIRQKKINIIRDIAGRPFTVEADPALFERVVFNLLENAVKYTGAGGAITVRAYPRPGQRVIEFEDTGVGISEADLPRIFERFYRADKSRARESGGTGLGLAIAKHILERHGGQIEVESELQKGSKFRIILSHNRQS